MCIVCIRLSIRVQFSLRVILSLLIFFVVRLYAGNDVVVVDVCASNFVLKNCAAPPERCRLPARLIFLLILYHHHPHHNLHNRIIKDYIIYSLLVCTILVVIDKMNNRNYRGGIGPQDHELKRQYLGLLETRQVIEICLMLDVYVAPYVRGMIWPQDLGAAITGLRKSTTSNGGANGASTAAGVGASAATMTTSNDDDGASVSTTRSGRKEGEEEPVMASLDGLKEGSGGRVVENGERVEKASQEVTKTAATTTEMETAPMSGLAQVSTSSTGASASTSATPAPTSSTPAPTSSTPAPASAAPAPAPNQQQPPYPHQPYGYPQHPTAAYPHAPYYPPPPPGYPSYPPSSYPHYPPPPNGYPTAPGGYPLPYSTPSSHPHQQSFPHLHPPPPHPQSHAHQEQTPDEIPSYEEMIVEALQESASADPEGCAPKDLFSWMAARYPLQSNFRPSASQALQKAFKRGRLEKSSNGKYRLSGTWEGGSVSASAQIGEVYLIIIFW